jgi:hypothetical protein
MTKFLKKIFPIIFLFLVVCLFFYKTILKGLIPIASDIPTGMYYPWINHNYGYSVRVPVKNPILTDTVSQFWIWRNWGVNGLKSKKILFWNPYSLSGYSMSPWFHTILFSPANLFYVFFDTTTAMSLIVIIQLLIALVSSYFFIKEITSSVLSSIFGSISFSFSSFFICWLTWGTISWTLAFLPLILFFLHKILYKKITFTRCLGLFFSSICSFLGGHPQTFLYVVIIILIYVLSYLIINIKKIKIIIPVLIIFILCVLSTTFITIPSFQILKNSIRENENYIGLNNSGFIPIGKMLITLFAPDFFGNPTTNNYWGGDFNYQEKLVWFGTTALILVVFYFISLIKQRKKINHINLFLIIIFILGILLSTKYPIGFLIYKFKLPLISTSSAGRAMIFTIFSGSILAALAIKNLEKCLKGNKFISKWTSIIFLVFIFVLISLLFFLKYSLIKQNDFENNFVVIETLKNIHISIRNLIIPCGIAFSCLFCLNLINRFKKYTKLIILFFIFLATCEGIRYGWKYTPFTDKKLFFPETEVITFLKEKYKNYHYPFRIAIEKAEIMPPNMWQVYGFLTASGYDPIYPINYAKYLDSSSIIKNPSRYVEWENKNLDKASILSIKYFLALKRDKDNKVNSEGKIPNWLNLKKWTKVYEEKAVVVFENKDFNLPFFLENKNNSTVELIKETGNLWEFRVVSKDNNKLILLENTDPNWKVFVNNQPRSIIPFEGTFKSVEVKSGESIVKFVYKNNLFIKFTKFSITSFIFSLIVFFIFTKIKLNKKT